MVVIADTKISLPTHRVREDTFRALELVWGTRVAPPDAVFELLGKLGEVEFIYRSWDKAPTEDKR